MLVSLDHLERRHGINFIFIGLQRPDLALLASGGTGATSDHPLSFLFRIEFELLVVHVAAAHTPVLVSQLDEARAIVHERPQILDHVIAELLDEHLGQHLIVEVVESARVVVVECLVSQREEVDENIEAEETHRESIVVLLLVASILLPSPLVRGCLLCITKGHDDGRVHNRENVVGWLRGSAHIDHLLSVYFIEHHIVLNRVIRNHCSDGRYSD